MTLYRFKFTPSELYTAAPEQLSMVLIPEFNPTPESSNEVSYDSTGSCPVFLGGKDWVWEVKIRICYGEFFDVPYRHVGILPHECIQEKVLAKGFLHQRKILTQYLVGTLHATHFYWRESCRLI